MDETTFKNLFYQLYQSLYSQAYRMLNNPEVAEEVVQDAFVNFWIRQADLPSNTNSEAYLRTSVRNLSLNYLKSQYAQLQVISIDQLDVVFESGEDKDQNQRKIHIIQEGIQQLPSKCRIIFEMSRYGGLTYQEIADELGISKESVKTQIRIALQKLQAFLKQYLPFWLLLVIFFH